MPSLINTQPLGLLSLLGIKSVGVNPSLLADTVQPTIDLTALLAGYGQELITGATASLNSRGAFGAFAAVPAGEVWRVESFAVYNTSALAAGTTYRIAPVIFNNSSGIASYIGLTETFTAGDQMHVGMNCCDFLIPSGFALGVWVSNVTLGTAVSCVSGARINRLSV